MAKKQLNPLYIQLYPSVLYGCETGIFTKDRIYMLSLDWKRSLRFINNHWILGRDFIKGLKYNPDTPKPEAININVLRKVLYKDNVPCIRRTLTNWRTIYGRGWTKRR